MGGAFKVSEAGMGAAADDAQSFLEDEVGLSLECLVTGTYEGAEGDDDIWAANLSLG